MSTEESFVVCYHYPCPDGIFAALAAYLALKDKKLRFFPLKVNEATIHLPLDGDETVYMCDFTGPPGFVHDVASRCKKVVVLDHHKTAQELLSKEVPENVELNIDMDRCGSVITREYFQPDMPDQFADVYKWVQDVDLWTWKLKPSSEEWGAGFTALNLNLNTTENPLIFEQILALKVDDVLERGRTAIDDENRWVEDMAKQAVIAQVGGKEGKTRGWGRCLAVSFPEGPCNGNRSKLGNVLALAAKARAEEEGKEESKDSEKTEMLPVGLVVYREKDMMKDPSLIKVSFRGCGDVVDTTVFAQHYKGGGHRLASSCIVPTEHWEEWVEDENDQ